jgi:hypothetical protein
MEPNGMYHVLFMNSSCLCQEFSDNPSCCDVPTIKVADGAVNPLNPDYTAKVCEGIVEVLKQNCYPPEVVQVDTEEAAIEEEDEEPVATRSIDIEEPTNKCDAFKRWYILIPIIFSLIMVIVALLFWYNLHQERKKNKRLEEELSRMKNKNHGSNATSNSIYPIKDSAVQRMEEDCEAAIAGSSSYTSKDSSSYSARCSHLVDKTEYEEASESNSECWEVEDVEIVEVVPRKEAKNLLKVKL